MRDRCRRATAMEIAKMEEREKFAAMRREHLPQNAKKTKQALVKLDIIMILQVILHFSVLILDIPYYIDHLLGVDYVGAIIWVFWVILGILGVVLYVREHKIAYGQYERYNDH